ncbi:MAG: DNA methyltransferase, partial [Candidatus Thermoplasmatota archaeon]|nr:DNA methyltransferase [Candidatus Thermoplasmatota archaeon]
MVAEHTTTFGDASDMSALEDGLVQLMVTSPPYPMIEMWDEGFGETNSAITDALDEGDGWRAFELMHGILDGVWEECYRVLSDGGFACINIGDATRTIDDEFALYTNRARIDMKMIELGFTPLPSIIWRKQSNAPNKFMGSGTLPAGAYVTH